MVFPRVWFLWGMKNCEIEDSGPEIIRIGLVYDTLAAYRTGQGRLVLLDESGHCAGELPPEVLAYVERWQYQLPWIDLSALDPNSQPEDSPWLRDRIARGLPLSECELDRRTVYEQQTTA
jgi:hypothetical protein